MPQTIITHDGKFHADDVFAVAALLILNKDAKVVRTRDSRVILGGDIVVDVGGVYDEQKNRFDHHQIEGVGTRKNGLPVAAGVAHAGIPYAAFGLVWKKFGEKLCGDTSAQSRVEEILVVPIDANDNGIDLSLPKFPGSFSYEISDVVRSFTPTWQEGESYLESNFNEAVSFARRIIEREIQRAKAFVAGEQKVQAVYNEAADKRLIILDGDYSWKDVLSRFPEPLYVVHPQNGTWRLYSVRDNPHLFVNRRDLPQSWAGLRDAKLAKITGVPDSVFCHRNRFMAVAKSKNGAIALAKLALDF